MLLAELAKGDVGSVIEMTTIAVLFHYAAFHTIC